MCINSSQWRIQALGRSLNLSIRVWWAMSTRAASAILKEKLHAKSIKIWQDFLCRVKNIWPKPSHVSKSILLINTGYTKISKLVRHPWKHAAKPLKVSALIAKIFGTTITNSETLLSYPFYKTIYTPIFKQFPNNIRKNFW